MFKFKYDCIMINWLCIKLRRKGCNHTFVIAFRKMSVSFIAYSCTNACKEEIKRKKKKKKQQPNLQVGFSKYLHN